MDTRRPEITIAIEPLTKREIEVLILVARCFSNQEIAEKLCFTIETAKRHVQNIMVKLGLHRRTSLAVYAVQSGLLPLHDIILR